MPSIAARLRLTSFVVAAGLLAGAGCSGVPSSYGEDRLRDLADVIDVRYGMGFGLGLELQFGEIFRTGLGSSMEWSHRQWFGRKSVEVENGVFAGGVIVVYDGDYLRRLAPGEWLHGGSDTTGATSLLFLTVGDKEESHWSGTEEWFTEPGGKAPLLTTARIGGALFLPGVNGGLYLNVGEVVDFVSGVFGADIMRDDGYPKYSSPETPAEPGAPQKTPPAAPHSTPPATPPAAPAG